MFARKSNYETAPDPDTLDDLSKKLAVDLRKHVRRLDAHPLFTADWLSMVDSLVHISNIAMMEHRLPRNEMDSNTTLWEGDELTVRFMLEEGKLNLCLRLMHDFCRQRYSPALMAEGQAKQWLKNTAADLSRNAPEAKLSPEQAEGRILTFEQGMGVLLRCAFEHVEAVQTTDLPELIEHASEVFGACQNAPSGSFTFERTQPALLLRYLSSIMMRVQDDKLPEDKVMPLMQQCGLVQLVVAHVCAHHASFKPEDLSAGLNFMARVFETEAVCDEPQAFLPSQLRAELKCFEPSIKEMTPDERRNLRPLLDAIQGQMPFRY